MICPKCRTNVFLLTDIVFETEKIEVNFSCQDCSCCLAYEIRNTDIEKSYNKLVKPDLISKIRLNYKEHEQNLTYEEYLENKIEQLASDLIKVCAEVRSD